MNLTERILASTSILNVADKISSLKLNKIGDIRSGDCPTGHPSVGGLSFCIIPEKNIFFCFNCGVEGNIIDLVKLIYNLSDQKAIEWIVNEFHPKWKDELKELEIGKIQTKPSGYYLRAFLYELVYRRGRKLMLETENGQNTLLRISSQRNYKRKNIRDTEWCYFPPDKEIRSYLVQEYPETHGDVFGTPKKAFSDKLPLQGQFGDKYRLAFPYRDRYGLITGFVKRALIRESKEKWDFTQQMVRDDLFNLYASKNEDSVMLLEGYTDVMYLPTLGFGAYSLVAIGRDELKDSFIDGLKKCGINNIVIFFNNPSDPGARVKRNRRMESIIHKLKESDFKVFVIDPGTLGEHKDPEDFVLGNKISELPPMGIEKLQEIVREETRNSAVWLAELKVQEWKESETTRQREILHEMIDRRNDIENAIELNEYDDVIKNALNLSESAFWDIVRQRKIEKEKRSLSITFKNVIRESLKLEGDVADVQRVKAELDHLFAKYSTEVSTSGSELSDRLNENLKKEKLRIPGDFVGYHMNRYESIAKELNGLQPGLYILAADEGSGKTMFLTNFFMDFVFANPHVQGVFISLDESMNDLIEKCLACHFGIALSDLKYSVSGPKQLVKQKAYSQLIDMAKRERLIVKDISEIDSFTQLKTTINSTVKEHAMVCIDSIHFLSAESNEKTGIKIDIGSQLRALALTHKIPIMVSCPLNLKEGQSRWDDMHPPLMKDIWSYDVFAAKASQVWLLYPEKYELLTSKNTDKVPMILSIEKNKFTYQLAKKKFDLFRKEGLQFLLPEL